MAKDNDGDRARPAAAATPQRVLRRRSKGWRMPPNTVYVGRPSRFGNPFDWMIVGRPAAVDFYRRWLSNDLSPAERQTTGIDLEIPDSAEAHRQHILAALPTLRGRNLACWCPPGEPCHADVLLELANR